MKIDINKKYRTRDGREVIIHAIDGPNGKEPVVASINNSGSWSLATWSIDGVCSPNMSYADLIEVREPREWEIVVSTKENRTYKSGTIDGVATDDLQRGERDIPLSAWEIVRVREIID